MTVLRRVLAATVAVLLCLAVASYPALAAGDVPVGDLPAGDLAIGDLAAATPAADDPPSPKKLFTITDSRVVESSGLAKSAKHKGIWWTMNDSGDSARIFAVNTDGEVAAVLTFGTEVRDLEAIAVDEDGVIYVGDIGDNGAVRDFISVYKLTEPEVLESQRVRFRRLDFQYPDGAHDAETLLVHPQSHRLYFVTKTKVGPAAFYSAPTDPSIEGVNDLKRVAAAPSGITDGTFLPDARRLVLRSYVDITAYGWTGKPKLQGRAAVPLALGESVALGPTNTSVVVGSEGEESVVYQVRVPAAPKAAPSTSPAVKPAAVPAGTKKNHNLRWILIGAGAFALLVALITFPAGRRERDDALMEESRMPDHRPTRRPPPYGGEPPTAY